MGTESSSLEISNAKIEGAWLGYEEHYGIMTSSISLDYGRSNQTFGGWVLKDQTMYIWVKRILEVVGVQHWEDLKGKSVRVEHDWSKVIRIGHFLEDKWFNPTEEFEALNANISR